MSDTTTAVVQVDIVEHGRALVSGPGFRGLIGTDFGPRSATNRPTYLVTLSDDTTDGDRPPLAYATRSRRKSFPEAARDMARLLAAHYGVTDATIELDDETGTYTLPQEV